MNKYYQITEKTILYSFIITFENTYKCLNIKRIGTYFYYYCELSKNKML